MEHLEEHKSETELGPVYAHQTYHWTRILSKCQCYSILVLGKYIVLCNEGIITSLCCSGLIANVGNPIIILSNTFPPALNGSSQL